MGDIIQVILHSNSIVGLYSQNMSFPSDRLLDVDKIKELAALIIKCDSDVSQDLINPLFELVS